MSRLQARKDLRSATKAFQKISHTSSIIQILNTVLPLMILAVLSIRLLQTRPYISFLLSVPMAALVIRTFMLQHDCSHASFFRSKAANNIVGFLLGIVTMTPHAAWRKFHLMHHAGSGKLERRGFGDIKTMTVDEYQMATPGERLRYGIYRHPAILFGFGAFLFFLVRQRFTFKLEAGWKQELLSVHLTNVGIAMLLLSILLFCDKPFVTLGLYAVVMFLAAGIGVWLFFIQHQFPDAYWEKNEDWSFYDAAIDGSSYYKLSPILRWATANIGFHHIHHLNPALPNYVLAECQAAVPGFSECKTVTLKQSFRYATLALWDAASQRMVSFEFTTKNVHHSTSQVHP